MIGLTGLEATNYTNQPRVKRQVDQEKSVGINAIVNAPQNHSLLAQSNWVIFSRLALAFVELYLSGLEVIL